MSIELKITAGDANELAQQIGMLAVAMSAAFQRPQPGESQTFVEPVQSTEAPKKTRAKKGATIDHDPNEGGNADVLRTAGVDGVRAAETVTETGTAAADAEGHESKVSELAAEVAVSADAPTGVDAHAPADATTEKTMTFDEMRQYTIAYLNDAIPTAEGRKNEFRSILDVFNAVKLGDISQEKFPEVIAEVDRRKAVKKG